MAIKFTSGGIYLSSTEDAAGPFTDYGSSTTGNVTVPSVLVGGIGVTSMTSTGSTKVLNQYFPSSGNYIVVYNNKNLVNGSVFLELGKLSGGSEIPCRGVSSGGSFITIAVYFRLS